MSKRTPIEKMSIKLVNSEMSVPYFFPEMDSERWALGSHLTDFFLVKHLFFCFIGDNREIRFKVGNLQVFGKKVLNWR